MSGSVVICRSQKGGPRAKMFGKQWVRWLCLHNSWEAGLSACHKI